MEELLCELFGGLDFGFFRVPQSAKFFSRHDEFCRPYGTLVLNLYSPSTHVLGSIIPPLPGFSSLNGFGCLKKGFGHALARLDVILTT